MCEGEYDWCPDSMADGFCDDETNIADCLYDGGDCCGPDIDLTFCQECVCYE